ncbi:hypothetical protein ASG01_03150 [Chryseobacterium sp. Leaf180]|uniref:hypothetical protein n=1 Tax=Chryseobacterium sp. Leaf180 TaxID=1736289 RepID=UPI0006F311C2|nr:hypothetical protein [Chryseobacterium sp. Leaf180]KQR94876.1 hypothetical protein ASG01_03150 [Chryseobacterium sp. Leaf180]
MKTILASALILGLSLVSCKKEANNDSTSTTDTTMTDTTSMTQPMAAPMDSTGSMNSGSSTMSDSTGAAGTQMRGDSARTTTR